MNFGDRPWHTQQRPFRASENRDLGIAGKLHDPTRVVGGLRRRHIAGDGGDAENLDLQRRQRQQQGKRVVLSGVGVNDHAMHGKLAVQKNPASSAQTMRAWDAPRFTESH